MRRWRSSVRNREALAMRADINILELLCDAPPPNEIRGELGIMFVRGPIDHHVSFGDSYERIVAAFHELNDDASVKAIVMIVDSPGGLVSGLNATVRALRKAKSKPVYAIADEMATSAAYALSCVADEIIATPSAVVGSVGVISTMCSQARADQRQGLDYVTITSGARKADGHPHMPIEDAAVAVEGERVDELAAQFYALVKESRGLSADYLVALEAGIFLGAEAEELGLIDEVLDVDDAIGAIISAHGLNGVSHEEEERAAPYITSDLSAPGSEARGTGHVRAVLPASARLERDQQALSVQAHSRAGRGPAPSSGWSVRGLQTAAADGARPGRGSLSRNGASEGAAMPEVQPRLRTVQRRSSSSGGGSKLSEAIALAELCQSVSPLKTSPEASMLTAKAKIAALTRKMAASTQKNERSALASQITKLLAALPKAETTKKWVKHEEEEETTSDEEEEEEGGNETDREEESDEPEKKDDEKKEASHSEEEEAESDEDEKKAESDDDKGDDMPEKKEKKAAARGELAALRAEVTSLRSVVAGVQQREARTKHEGVIAEALRTKRISPAEAKALTKETGAYVKAFLAARPKSIVLTPEEALRPLPKGSASVAAKSGGSAEAAGVDLTPEMQAMLDGIADPKVREQVLVNWKAQVNGVTR